MSLVIGAPGVGKTLLMKRLQSILCLLRRGKNGHLTVPLVGRKGDATDTDRRVLRKRHQGVEAKSVTKDSAEVVQ